MRNGGANSFGANRGKGSYAYRVRACNFAGCSPCSGIATVVVALPLGTSRLTTRNAPYQVQCSVGWNKVADVSEYQLESGGGGKRLYTGPNAYVSANGNAYCAGNYRVRACVPAMQAEQSMLERALARTLRPKTTSLR